MHKLYCTFILILFCILSYSSPRAESLTVAFTQWPPFKITTSTPIDGIDARIMLELGQRIGMEIEFKKCPWPRCITFIENGQADIITSFGKTEKREAFTYFLGKPYFTDSITFWVKKESAIDIKEYTELDGLKVGSIKGSVYFPQFNLDTGLHKEEVNYEVQLFRMLHAGRIDTFIGYETVIKYLLAKERFSKHFRKVSFTTTGNEYYLGMSKNSQHLQLREKLTKELAAMREEGVIPQIINQFISESSH